MGLFAWFQGLFGKPAVEEHPALDDPRVRKAIAALMKNVTLSVHMNKVEGTGADGPVIQAAKKFKALAQEFDDCPELSFAYAAALQVAMQGKTAEKVLAKCVEEHPDFWLAQATLEQKALQSWNLFYLPEFDSDSSEAVHPVINQTVSKTVLLATRRGVVPRAVLFLRDAGDEFPKAKLKSCKMEFLTTISTIKNPQVVAINGKIHDNPDDPFNCEANQCPLRNFGDRERLPYELLSRQDTFDFVILDRSGNVKHAREVTPSRKMQAAHAKLAEMLEATDGPKLSIPEILNAINRHQATLDPKTMKY